jgi:hypothetical protein
MRGICRPLRRIWYWALGHRTWFGLALWAMAQDIFLRYGHSAKFSYSQWATTMGGHRHRSQCRRYPTADIDICYYDIGDKYVGLKNVIPISEVFQYRHQSSFRYPTLKEKNFSPCRCESAPFGFGSSRYNTKVLCMFISKGMSNIGYRIKLYSDIRYNVGLRSLSPISDILISGSVRYHWSRILD